MKALALGFTLALIAAPAWTTNGPAAGVTVSLADHSAQAPEIAVGPDGSIHLVWIDELVSGSADPQSGGHSHITANNVHYARSTDGGKTFSVPVQINVKNGDVWGFSVSKPRIAVGRNGTIHVFYSGNDVNPYNGKPEAVALYTRSIDGGVTFTTPQKLNEMGKTDGSEFVHGGLTHMHVFGTLAVDSRGNVYTMWLDSRDMNGAGECCKIFMAVSRDDGATFERDREIAPADTCPCCQLTAFVDEMDRLFVGSRRIDGKFRDSTVMVSRDSGRTFGPRRRVDDSRWEIEGCPMKATSIAASGDTVVSAYFTAGKTPSGVQFSRSTDGGERWSTLTPVHPEAMTSDAPVVAFAGPVLHLFWHAKLSNGVRKLYTRKSLDLGGSFGPVQEFVTAAESPVQLPVIAGLPDGSAQVAWQQGNTIMTMRWR